MYIICILWQYLQFMPFQFTFSCFCFQQHRCSSSHNSLRGIHSIHPFLPVPLFAQKPISPFQQGSKFELQTFPNNIHRHTCYCLSSVKHFEQYKQYNSVNSVSSAVKSVVLPSYLMVLMFVLDVPSSKSRSCRFVQNLIFGHTFVY